MRTMQGNGVRADLDYLVDLVTLTGNYREKVNPYTEQANEQKRKLLKDMLPATEEILRDALIKKTDKLEIVSEDTLKLFIELTEMVGDIQLLDEELTVIQTIKEYKREVEQNEETYNQSTRTEEEDRITLVIENAVYRLAITAETDAYRKNYIITGRLSLNKHLESEGISLEKFNNNSYSSIEKVDTYIQNKLKKYKPFFTFNRAILVGHVRRYKVSPRLLRDMNMDVYESLDHIAKNEKMKSE